MNQKTVSCENCEACCCRLQVRLLTDTGVPDRHIEWRSGEIEVMRRCSDDGWCVALDRNDLRCSIYLQRPWVCREFAVGSPECLEERQRGGIIDPS